MERQKSAFTVFYLQRRRHSPFLATGFFRVRRASKTPGADDEK